MAVDLEKNSIREFDSWAKTYDSPSNRLFFYLSNRDIVSLLPQSSEFSILDVGVGTGILVEQILHKNKIAHIFGVDISPEMVKQAKRKFAGINRVSISLGSAGKLPHTDNSFDFVTCINSFHHHPDSLVSLREIKRVLKPTGKIIISDGSFDGLIRKIFFSIENRLNNEGMVYRYTKEQMKGIFTQAGFVNISQHNSLYFNLITQAEKKN